MTKGRQSVRTRQVGRRQRLLGEVMDLPVLFKHERADSEYAASINDDLLAEMKMVMADHRTDKTYRIDFLLDAYNNRDKLVAVWDAQKVNTPLTEALRDLRQH